MKKKKLITLIAGLLAVASMSAALVGCDSGSTNSTASTTQTSTAQTSAAQAQSTGTRVTSSDGSFSFVVPDGFTKSTQKLQSPAGNSFKDNIVFTNANGQLLTFNSVDIGIPDLNLLTQEALQESIQAQMGFGDVELQNFSVEPKGNGAICTFSNEVSASGMTVKVAQGAYLDADRRIIFLLTNSNGRGEVDNSILKTMLDSLEFQTSTASDVSSEPVASE